MGFFTLGSCIKKDRYFHGDAFITKIKPNAEECQKFCQETKECEMFAYHSKDFALAKKHNKCDLKRFMDGDLNSRSIKGIFSGPKFCSMDPGKIFISFQK